MLAKNTTIEELQRAMDVINAEHYDGNVIFRDHNMVGRRIRFTLRVKDSKGPGHRLGFCLTSTGKQRRLPCACWHVHGHFFDALFEIQPNAVIVSGKNKISIDGGNWQDRNIGSMFRPMMFSEACEC